MGHDLVGSTCKKLQVVKNHNHGKKQAVVLSDHEVELMRTLYEEYPRGHTKHLGYRRLAEKFGVSRSTAEKICRYIKRARLLK